MTKPKAIFKFNNGRGALLCSNCSIIIKTRIDMTDDEKKAMDGEINLKPQYCDECQNNIIK